MSGSTQHADVVVVGAGPIGVLNALGLAQAGLSVVLLDAAESIEPLPRAMVYHWSVLEGLERLGLLDAAKAAGFAKQDYAYRVHSTGEMIELDPGCSRASSRTPTTCIWVSTGWRSWPSRR